jgi:hypothetical protein
MHAALAVARQQGETRHVHDQRQQGHAHHQRRFRRTAQPGAPQHFRQRAKGQQQLQRAGQSGRAQLIAARTADGVECRAIDCGVCKHIERVGNQPGGLGPPAQHQFHSKHDPVQAQQPAQRAALPLWRGRRSGSHRPGCRRGGNQARAQAEWLQSSRDPIDGSRVHDLQFPPAQVDGEAHHSSQRLQGQPNQAFLGRTIHFRDREQAGHRRTLSRRPVFSD